MMYIKKSSFSTAVEDHIWRIIGCYCVGYFFSSVMVFSYYRLCWISCAFVVGLSVRTAAILYVLTRLYSLIEISRALAF